MSKKSEQGIEELLKKLEQEEKPSEQHDGRYVGTYNLTCSESPISHYFYYELNNIDAFLSAYVNNNELIFVTGLHKEVQVPSLGIFNHPQAKEISRFPGPYVEDVKYDTREFPFELNKHAELTVGKDLTVKIKVVPLRFEKKKGPPYLVFELYELEHPIFNIHTWNT